MSEIITLTIFTNGHRGRFAHQGGLANKSAYKDIFAFKDGLAFEGRIKVYKRTKFMFYLASGCKEQVSYEFPCLLPLE